MTVSATALAALSQAALSQAALSQAIDRVDQAAEGIRNSTQPSAGDADQVDLSTQAVRLLVAKNGYDAAIELAKTADEVGQRAIDLLA